MDYIGSRNDIIAQRNDMIMNRSPMSRIGQKVFFELLRYINKNDDEFFDVEIPLKIIEDEWHGGKDTYRNLKELRDEMHSWYISEKTVGEKGKEIERTISIMNIVEHEAGSGTLRLKLNDYAKPYLLNLSKTYTLLDTRNLKKLSTKGARLYEIVRCEGYKNEWIFTPEIFKKAIGISENQYDRISNLQKRVIEPLIKELNEKSDMNLSFKKYGRGKQVKYIITITKKDEILEDASGKPQVL